MLPEMPLVLRRMGVQGVAGSNPAVPTGEGEPCGSPFLRRAAGLSFVGPRPPARAIRPNPALSTRSVSGGSITLLAPPSSTHENSVPLGRCSGGLDSALTTLGQLGDDLRPRSP
jgi:hypothetical protein